MGKAPDSEQCQWVVRAQVCLTLLYSLQEQWLRSFPAVDCTVLRHGGAYPSPTRRPAMSRGSRLHFPLPAARLPAAALSMRACLMASSSCEASKSVCSNVYSNGSSDGQAYLPKPAVAADPAQLLALSCVLSPGPALLQRLNCPLPPSPSPHPNSIIVHPSPWCCSTPPLTSP